MKSQKADRELISVRGLAAGTSHCTGLGVLGGKTAHYCLCKAPQLLCACIPQLYINGPVRLTPKAPVTLYILWILCSEAFGKLSLQIASVFKLI